MTITIEEFMEMSDQEKLVALDKLTKIEKCLLLAKYNTLEAKRRIDSFKKARSKIGGQN